MELSSDAPTIDGDRCTVTIPVKTGVRLVERGSRARRSRASTPRHQPSSGNARRRVPRGSPGPPPPNDPQPTPTARLSKGIPHDHHSPAPARSHSPRRPVAALPPAPRTLLGDDTLVYARRNIQHVRQIPEKLLDVTMQPIMFVLLFAFVFGGAISVEGGNYREYLIGGILVQRLAFGLTGPADGDRQRPHRRASSTGSARCRRRARRTGRALRRGARRHRARHRLLLGAGLFIGWRPHSEPLDLVPARPPDRVRLGDDLARHLDRAHGAHPPTRCMGITPFIVGVPADVRQQRLRPRSSPCRRCLQWIAAWNPISAMVATVREALRQPDGPAHQGGLADDAPGRRRVDLQRSLILAIAVPGGAPPPPGPHHRLTALPVRDPAHWSCHAGDAIGGESCPRSSKGISAGAVFWGADLTGARFRDVEPHRCDDHATRGSSDVDIDALDRPRRDQRCRRDRIRQRARIRGTRCGRCSGPLTQTACVRHGRRSRT